MDGKILIIDDEAEAVENCRRLLTATGYQCVTETDPIRALAMIEKESPSLILTDLKMPGLGGIQVVRKARPEWDHAREKTGHEMGSSS